MASEATSGGPYLQSCAGEQRTKHNQSSQKSLQPSLKGLMLTGKSSLFLRNNSWPLVIIVRRGKRRNGTPNFRTRGPKFSTHVTSHYRQLLSLVAVTEWRCSPQLVFTGCTALAPIAIKPTARQGHGRQYDISRSRLTGNISHKSVQWTTH